MEKHVAVELLADKEPEATRGIEPFYSTRDRRKLGLRRIDQRLGDGRYLPRRTHKRTYHEDHTNTCRCVGKPTLAKVEACPVG